MQKKVEEKKVGKKKLEKNEIWCCSLSATSYSYKKLLSLCSHAWEPTVPHKAKSHLMHPISSKGLVSWEFGMLIDVCLIVLNCK